MAALATPRKYASVEDMYEKLFMNSPVSEINVVSIPIGLPAAGLAITSVEHYDPRGITTRVANQLPTGRMYTTEFGRKTDETMTPGAREHITAYFSEDPKNDDYDLQEEFEDLKDEDYVQPLEKKMGVYMENYICSMLHCPMCSKKLYKYTLSNQPVIDLYCKGNHPIKFFQVKTTKKGSRIELASYPKYYFINTKKYTNYIHVGSPHYGIYTHSIKPSDVYLYKALIGYILIEYEETDSPTNIIITSNSYIIIPNTRLEQNDELIDEYYRYLPSTPKFPVIEFNQNNMIIRNFLKIYPDCRIVNTTFIFETGKRIRPRKLEPLLRSMAQRPPQFDLELPLDVRVNNRLSPYSDPAFRKPGFDLTQHRLDVRQPNFDLRQLLSRQMQRRSQSRALKVLNKENNPFYNKYLKYKNKFLNLRKQIEEFNINKNKFLNLRKQIEEFNINKNKFKTNL